MSLLQSIFLGIVQGITEFLPVSSSGHLAILKNLFGVQTDSGLLFDVLLHFGTMIAIVVAFRKDIGRMIIAAVGMIRDIFYNAGTWRHNYKERDSKRYRKIIHNNYRKFTMLVIISTIPTAIIGYVARDLVAMAEQTLLVPGICLILTAGLLLVADVVEPGEKVPNTISLTNGFVIGIVQGLSTLPGLSRSGATITACLVSGFDSRFAVRYSFVMAVPAILGAMIEECSKAGNYTCTTSQVFSYIVGAAVAGIVGYFCIKKMLGIVRKKNYKGFALYCLVVGIIAIGGYLVHR